MYLKEKGYMPMLGTFLETGVFVDDAFRDGNVSPRADRASYQNKLINALEVDKNAAVMELVHRIGASDWTLVPVSVAKRWRWRRRFMR